jgi:hypothetical protein
MQHSRSSSRLAAVALAGSLALVGTAKAASDHLVVVTLGGQSGGVSGTLNSYQIGSYTTPDGIVNVSNIAGNPFSLSGAGSHDAELHASTNGQFLTLAGYGVAPGGTDPAGFSSSTVPRVIARIDGLGNVNESTKLTDAFDGTTFRAAITDDGTRFWVAGDNNGGATLSGGSRYVSGLGNSTSINISRTQTTGGSPTPDNVRDLRIFNNSAGAQLYGGSGSGSSAGKAAFSIGTGLPTPSSNTPTPITLLNTDAHDASSFFLADLSSSVAGVDTLYTEDGSMLRKYTFDGSTWTAIGSITLTGGEKMDAVVSGGSVQLFLGTLTTISTLTDSSGYGGTLTGSLTTVLNAPQGTFFGGIAVFGAVPEPSCLSFAAFAGMGLVRRRRRTG